MHNLGIVQRLGRLATRLGRNQRVELPGRVIDGRRVLRGAAGQQRLDLREARLALFDLTDGQFAERGILADRAVVVLGRLDQLVLLVVLDKVGPIRPLVLGRGRKDEKRCEGRDMPMKKARRPKGALFRPKHTLVFSLNFFSNALMASSTLP